MNLLFRFTKSVTCLALLLIFFYSESNAQSVDENIKMYSGVWDTIINQNKPELFNSDNFTEDLVIHTAAGDVTGIDETRKYYENFLTGFSDIQFTIVDIFGQGDKIVKYWNFKGTHTGDFFGIPATGKTVNVNGATIVRMSNGKIAEERDFFDNLEFMQQLGLIPR